MTPEQLATLLAKAVPEMRWTVDGEIVRGAPVPIEAWWREDEILLVRRDDGFDDGFVTPLIQAPPWRPRPKSAVRDDLGRRVGLLLSDADRATWARGLHARAEVLRCEAIATERGAAMKDAAEAYNEAVTALRSAQAQLEAVQDG